MTCSNCGKPTDGQKRIVYQGKLITGCDKCLHTLVQGNESSPKHSREWQKKQFRKELIQPNQPRDFVRAYGDKAREHGYTEEQMRKYS